MSGVLSKNKDMDLLELLQRRAMKMIRLLELLSYKVRLREPGKQKAPRRPYRDLQKGGIGVFLCQIVISSNDFKLKVCRHNY